MDAIRELSELASRYRLGLAHIGLIVGFAHKLLENSIYAQSAADIIYLDSPVYAEVSPLFESLCQELGVDIPDQDAAIDYLIRCTLESIVSESQSPLTGLSEIATLYYDFCMSEPVHKYVGDSRSVDGFISAYHRHLELLDSFSLIRDTSQEVTELETEVKLLARERMAQIEADS
jgi:hypothetical protein